MVAATSHDRLVYPHLSGEGLHSGRPQGCGMTAQNTACIYAAGLLCPGLGHAGASAARWTDSLLLTQRCSSALGVQVQSGVHVQLHLAYRWDPVAIVCRHRSTAVTLSIDATGRRPDGAAWCTWRGEQLLAQPSTRPEPYVHHMAGVHKAHVMLKHACSMRLVLAYRSSPAPSTATKSWLPAGSLTPSPSLSRC